MSTPATCVYDIHPPRRPSLDDVGGGAKEDDQEFPPNPVTDATANDANQTSNLLVRLNSVAPVAVLSIHSSGSPVVYSVATMIGGVTSATFTIVHNGSADDSITWPVNTFPAAVIDPDAKPTGATAGSATAEKIANGARVRCSANINYNLYIYGQ